eukprot:CAMPEP_0174718238 /NCGR_PEP_ID=MMETSP1094-20130205/28373_1 /TAXON_ID=156173 /ORGANISM="Chrysochromulina brevifilum, Strain UTEX LB 985" /LENGTH=65 /DNA_ID=CAMNT_0015918291 /DNA_START=597 /DNA_END=794 /DNA_ORIENTATION=+
MDSGLLRRGGASLSAVVSFDDLRERLASLSLMSSCDVWEDWEDCCVMGSTLVVFNEVDSSSMPVD